MEQNPYAAPRVEALPSGGSEDGGAGRPRDWTVSEVLGVGWNAVKEQPVPLIGGMALVLIVQWVVQGTLQAVFVGDALQKGDLARYFTGTGITAPVTMVLSVFLMIGQLRVALTAARGKPVEIATYFSGYDKLLPGLLAMFLVYLGVLLGVIFFLIPGIIAGLAWSLSLFHVVEADVSPTQAMALSWEQTKGQRGKLFLYYFACGLVVLLGVLALGVGMFVAMPVVLVSSAQVYRCVSGAA